MKILKTEELDSIRPFLKKLYIPLSDSHKGQNGRVLVIGGSSLFHSSSIWAAEVASYFADMVHYASTVENNEIFLSWKKKFRNGIVVAQKDLIHYAQEDDVILIGPGIMREGDESIYAKQLIEELLAKFPHKRFVLDAGALQLMDKKWLSQLKIPAIVTPHQKEFQMLFGEDIQSISADKKADEVKKYAKQYKCIILLKAIVDIVSDGESTIIVEGGNAGLTKGGTGDLLAGLVTAFYAKNTPLVSSVLASYLLKKSVDDLSPKFEYWYNNDILLESIPQTLVTLRKNT